MKDYKKPDYKNPLGYKFDVVICRYDEETDFINSFSYYPCEVHLYNKGERIENNFAGRVNIIECDNIGFEDFTYVKFLSENEIKRPIIFMQCNLDHCPRLFEYLDNFEKFSYFESLSDCSGLRDPVIDEMIGTDYGVMIRTDLCTFSYNDILSIFSKSFDIKDMMFDRYNVCIKSDSFVPGAQFYISDVFLDKNIRFDIILKDIEYASTLGGYISKKLASVFERYLWKNIGI